MLYAVFDTNIVKNAKSFDQLLGSYKDLKAISDCATIIIPEMVLDEILEDKRRVFFGEIKSMNNSPTRKIMGLPSIEGYDEKWSSIEEKLRKDQSIPFHCVGVKDREGAFIEACKLAVNHEAPFKEKSDKGFKDFVIGWTIKELLAAESNSHVIVLTKDKRFQEYLKKTLKVGIAETIQEFMQLTQHLESDARQKVAHVATSVIMPLIGGSQDGRDDINSLINELKNSNSFSTTRNLISSLGQVQNSFNINEKIALLRIALINNQIKWILQDNDIEHFFLPLFEECGNRLTVREADELVASFRQKPIIEKCASMNVDEDAINIYLSFVRELETSIISIEPEARIETLSFRILPRLATVIADNSLDKRIPYGSDVYECFIEQGEFKCMSWGFDFDILDSFVKMMECTGWGERFLICRNIASRIRVMQDFQSE